MPGIERQRRECHYEHQKSDPLRRLQCFFNQRPGEPEKKRKGENVGGSFGENSQAQARPVHKRPPQPYTGPGKAEKPESLNIVVLGTGGLKDTHGDGCGQNRCQKLPAFLSAELGSNKGGPNNGTYHAEPLNEIGKPITAAQGLEMSNGKLCPWIEFDLTDDVCRVMGY